MVVLPGPAPGLGEALGLGRGWELGPPRGGAGRRRRGPRLRLWDDAVADCHGDCSRRKNPLARAQRLARADLAGIGLAAVGAVLAALALGVASLWAVAVALAAGTVYSVGPRVKGIPVAGTAANALIFAPLLLLGQAAAGPASGLWLLVAVFVGLLLQNQLVHEQLDREEDRAAGARTTAVVLGRRGLAAMVAGVTLLAAAGAALAPGPGGPRALGVAAVVAGGLFAGLAAPSGPDRTRRGHRWFSLAAGLALFASLLW